MRLRWLSGSAAVLLFFTSAPVLAQSVAVTFGPVPEGIPLLGRTGLLLLVLALALLAAWRLRRAGPYLAAAVLLLGGGLLAGGSGAWLMGQARAVVAAAEWALSEHDGALRVTEFPALLSNDLPRAQELTRMQAQCAAGESASRTGSCGLGTVLAAAGGSCTLDLLCALSPDTGAEEGAGAATGAPTGDGRGEGADGTDPALAFGAALGHRSPWSGGDKARPQAPLRPFAASNATTFGAQQVISSAADGAFDVATADLDGDGDLDVLSASRFDNKIAWYKNDGAGSFGAQQVISTDADGAYSVATADLDGDGDLDV
ncbi:MAG: midcut-by-XrtH protein, partial [Xanthomonadales bacterium]|nr:midcut-by-XrtH protein [Xanthomonadales bacterium]